MGIVLLHTADWQLGRRFRSFDPGLASALEDARLDAIDTMAGLARSAGASHVVVAGDVFDAEDLPDKVLRQSIERMRAHDTLTWWLLPGNHDPARPRGVWSRFVTMGGGLSSDVKGLPAIANIVPLVEASPVAMQPGVLLLPAPLTARIVTQDPTAWMDAASSPPGSIRIGLAHGSIQGFGRADSANAPIDPRRAAKASLDYLALGDWHGATRADARTWYAGTPEPDSFDGNAPGHALVVRIAAAGAEPDVERVRTGRYAWHKAEVALVPGGDMSAALAPIEQMLADAGASLSCQLLRLALRGRITTARQQQLFAWRDTIDARLRHLELDTSRLAVIEGDDGAAIDRDPVLAGIVVRLRAIETGPDQTRAREAAAALRRLTEFHGRHREAAE